MNRYRRCRRLVGGNSGYDGYRMSWRAVEARNNGRYPKTDFRRIYKMSINSLNALVKLRIIGDNEWHHTGCYGRQTTFYYWRDDDDKEVYLNNKKLVDRLAKEYRYEEIIAIFNC